MHGTAQKIDRVHGELLSKICAGHASQPSFGDISLDITSQKVTGPDGVTRLTEMEYKILWLLVRARGIPISVDEIVYFLYEDTDDDIPLANCVRVFVCRVRKKIEQVKATVNVEMFRGFGYLLLQTP